MRNKTDSPEALVPQSEPITRPIVCKQDALFIPGASKSPSARDRLESEIEEYTDHLISNLKQLNRYSRNVRRYSEARNAWPQLKPNILVDPSTIIIGQRNLELQGVMVIQIECRNRRLARTVVDRMSINPCYKDYYFQTEAHRVKVSVLKEPRC